MAKLVEVTDQKELEALWIAYDSVGAPFLHQDLPYAPCYADADELRKWRASQSISEAASALRQAEKELDEEFARETGEKQ